MPVKNKIRNQNEIIPKILLILPIIIPLIITFLNISKMKSRFLSYGIYALLSFLLMGVTGCSGEKAEKEAKIKEILANTPVPQEWTLAFDKTEHNFGNINENDGIDSTVFTFVNRGKSIVIINNVQASCGCTTPDWSKEPIAPGELGYIKASYNPHNRPGGFNKSITVFSNGEPQSMVLHISGNVIREGVPGPESVKFETLEYDFGKIKEKGGSVSFTFNFKNTGTTPIAIDGVHASCGCTTPEWSKDPIAPGASGFVKATYDPLNRIGIFDKTVTVHSNGNPGDVILHIKGEVLKD